MELYIIWGLIGVGFLIAEMFLGAFYALSVALGAFAAAIVTYFSGNASLDWIQMVAFSAVSILSALVLPRFAHGKRLPSDPLDLPIGQIVELARVGEDWKVKVYGVDYLVAPESIRDDFSDWKKVRIEWKQGISIRVVPV